MRRSVVRAILCLEGVVLLGGCSTYRPADLRGIRPDSRVRVTVSAERAVALEPVTREVRRQFVATYLGEQGSSLLMAVPLLSANPGTVTRAVHSRVEIPRADVVAVETRELSTWRTVAVAGMLALVGYGGYEVFR